MDLVVETIAKALRPESRGISFTCHCDWGHGPVLLKMDQRVTHALLYIFNRYAYFVPGFKAGHVTTCTFGRFWYRHAIFIESKLSGASLDNLGCSAGLGTATSSKMGAGSSCIDD